MGLTSIPKLHLGLNVALGVSDESKLEIFARLASRWINGGRAREVTHVETILAGA